MKSLLLALSLLIVPCALHGQRRGESRTGDARNNNGIAPSNEMRYVDGKTYTTIQACIDSFSSDPGVCLIPGNYTGAPAASLPDNVEVWDLTRQGRLAIRGFPRTSPALSAGLWVGLGPLSDTFSGPIANNLVGVYSEVHCPGGTVLCWGANPLVNLEPEVRDASVWGLEVDTNIFGTDRTQQYAGIDVVSGGSVNPTFAFRAYNTAGPGIASWKDDFRTNGAAVNIFDIDSPNTGLKITESIKSSGRPQSVSTNAPSGAQIFIGMTISIGLGKSQENVVITNISGAYSITGVFLKDHPANTGFTQYSAQRFWEPNNAVSLKYPYHLGSIQSFNAFGSPDLALGFSVTDSEGTERLADFYTPTNVHTWRDIGTSGFAWEDQAGNRIAALSDDGDMRWAGLQTARVPGCRTGATVGGTCDIIVAWPRPFSDTNYTAQCTGDGITTGTPIIQGLNISMPKTPFSITVRTLNMNSTASQFATVDCMAIHD